MLEINKNHKKANLNKLVKPLKTIAVSLTVPAVIFVYSGSVVDSNVYADDNSNKSEVSLENKKQLVPDMYYTDVRMSLDGDKQEIKKEDLAKIKELDFNISSAASLDFLKYCKNLKNLHVLCMEGDTNSLNTLPKMDSLKKLTIVTTENIGIITEENDEFIKSCKDLESLTLYGLSLGPNTVEKMKNLKTLKIVRSKNIDIDYDKTTIKTLDLSECGVYDIPILLDSETYTKIKDDIEVKFGSEKKKEKYLEISKRLDNIITSLNLKSKKTEKEKLDTVLCYVLENLKYDPRVANSNEYEDVPDDDYFYKGGNLYAALEKDTVMCGNYAALMKALCKKAGIETYYISSNFHAWNLVKIEGDLYCIDATWIDGSNNIKAKIPTYNEQGEIVSYKKGTEDDLVIDNIKHGKTSEYDWYLTSPSESNMKKLDSSGDHNFIGYPSYMEDEIKDSSTSEIDVSIEDKKLKTSMGALVGTLSAFGGARLIKKQLKENKHDKKRA